MKQLKVYNIGDLGVDLVNSPLHVEDTHVLSCQNAQVSPDDREGALKKRDGMSVINAVPAAGTLLAIINIPVAT
jgi:hypothetical protein